jgi:hypothetical protein
VITKPEFDFLRRVMSLQGVFFGGLRMCELGDQIMEFQGRLGQVAKDFFAELNV